MEKSNLGIITLNPVWAEKPEWEWSEEEWEQFYHWEHETEEMPIEAMEE